MASCTHDDCYRLGGLTKEEITHATEIAETDILWGQSHFSQALCHAGDMKMVPVLVSVSSEDVGREQRDTNTNAGRVSCSGQSWRRHITSHFQVK